MSQTGTSREIAAGLYDVQARDIQAREIEAPRQNRAAIVRPPWDQVGPLLAAAEESRRKSSGSFLGSSWQQAAAQAKAEVTAEALAYTRSYRDMDMTAVSRPVLMAGHQGELFHPGVWFKNFALGRLAQLYGATAINLVIDNDAFKAGSIQVPRGPVTDPRLHRVALDRNLPDQGDVDCPAEERPIIDPAYLAGFPERVTAHLAGLVEHPLVSEFWSLVVARSRQTRILGACLSQARHQWEGRWGNATLELPFSHVCRTQAFVRFAAQVLLQLPTLWQVYNQSLREFRRAHRMRSVTHPVPDLASDGEFLEAPLWVWTADDLRRRRLFVRHDGHSVTWTDRSGWQTTLPVNEEGHIQRLAQLAGEGVRIRTKAIFTTLFARLFLSDLFLHGIGGAKYDVLTDAIALGWLGVRPPAYMTLSATLHLPVTPTPLPATDELRQIDDDLRRLIWQPERWVEGTGVGGQESGDKIPSDVAAFVQRKQQLVAQVSTIHTAKTRCRAIREINLRLQPFVENRRQELRAQREQKRHEQKAYDILSSREFAWCLFPEEILRGFLLAILPGNA